MAAARSRWVLGVSMLGCLAAFLVALIEAGSTHAEPARPAPPAAKSFGAPGQGDEVVAWRTANSRVFRRGDGRFEARIWAQPVNYRSGGAWKAIDTTLKPDGADQLKSAATPAGVELPRSLGDPARVSGGSRWVSFRLLGADGDVAPRTAGASATYSDALDGVDVRYDAKATGVKETLTLAGASAPAVYRYAIDASSGLRPVLRRSGAVVFRDGSGATRFWLPAPTVQEHGAATPTTEHVAYRLSKDDKTLTVAVDSDWLSGARFPVRVDPTAYYGDDVSCTIADGTLEDTADCGGATLKVGNDGDHTYRSVLRFPTLEGVMPRTASVDYARLAMWFDGQTDADPDPLSIIAASGLSRPVAQDATWNMYDDVHGWDSPGGDWVSDPQAEWQWMVPDYEDGWVSWDISRLADSWLHDPASNNGLILKAVDEGQENVVTFDGHDAANGGPNIAVSFEWHPGYESDQTYESVAYNGDHKISLNTATGNVAVDSTDISLPGTGGLGLKVRRTFNGQDLGDATGIYGSGWTLSVNDAAYVNGRTWFNDQRTLYLNGGAIYRFDRDYDHDTATTYAYISPANLNADLVSDDDGTAVLTYRDTGIKYTYAPSWDGESFALSKISDPAGHHIDLAPVSGDPRRIGTITGSDGTVLTFHYGTNNKLTKITTSANSSEWKYTTNIAYGHNRLVGYTNPANQTTTYAYDDTLLPDPWDKITSVTDTTGQKFSFDYGPDGDWSQVTRITQDFNTSAPDSVTNIDYTPPSSNGHSCTSSAVGRTVMTDDQNRKTTWCYDNNGHVIKAWRPWDTTAPTSSPSGEWYDLAGQSDDGTGTHSVTLAGADPSSGVRRVALEWVGHGELASATAPCGPRTVLPQLCPASYSATVSFDANTLPEGTQTFRQATTDLAGNVGYSATWTVTIVLGRVVHATVYADDTSTDPTPISEDWAQIGTLIGRSVEEDAITTLDHVACPTGTCAELRQRTVGGGGATADTDGYVRYRGTTTTDERIGVASDMTLLGLAALTDPPTSSGSTSNVIFPWQTLPPGAGTTYEVYETHDTIEDGGTATDGPSGEVDSPVVRETRNRLVLDATTKLPLRQTTFAADNNELLTRRIWTYDPNITLRRDLPADFFALARPATPDFEKNVEYADPAPTALAARKDAATGSSYEPATLTASARVAGDRLCPTGRRNVTHTERPTSSEIPDDGHQPQTFRSTRTVVTFAARTAAGNCPKDAPTVLTLQSTAPGSPLADAWESGYEDMGAALKSAQRSEATVEIDGVDETVAVLDIDGTRHGAYLERGGTALVVSGEYAPEELDSIVSNIEG